MFNYNEKTLKSTNELVQAVLRGDRAKAREAIQNGAQVNCRIVSTEHGEFEVASEAQLSRVLTNQAKPYTGDMPAYSKDTVLYEVPMVGTTTLLNVLARKTPLSPDDLALSSWLMDNGAELGGIDYLSHWVRWGSDNAANYFQNTPLLNAIACNNLPFASLYMDYLQRLDAVKRQEILNYKDKFYAGFHTALEFAIRRGYSGLATSIVRAGADPNPQPFVFSYGGKSPLHMACMLLGNAKYRGAWHPLLGSDLELIITLLEQGADYTKRVPTEIYIGKNSYGVNSWKTLFLTPFDYLSIAAPGIPQLKHSFDLIEACAGKAFNPTKIGQIKHPFEEEECFLSGHASLCRQLGTRQKYLNSQEFCEQDKLVIQKALLKRIIQEYNSKFPPGLEEMEMINALDDVGEIMAILLMNKEERNESWLYDRFRLAGLVQMGYLEKRGGETLLKEEENPLFNPSLRNKIAHCAVNYYREQAKISEEVLTLEETPQRSKQAPAIKHSYQYGKNGSRFHALNVKAPATGLTIQIGGECIQIVPANSNLSSDRLKRTILDNVVLGMGKINTLTGLEVFKTQFKQSEAYTKILAQPQGLITAALSFFGKQTDSVKALDQLFVEKEKHLGMEFFSSTPKCS